MLLQFICGPVLAIALAVAQAAVPAPPVTWSAQMDPATLAPGQKARVVVSAAIQPGWHVYGLAQPPGGPTPTIIVLADGPLFVAAGSATGPAPHVAYDPSFQMKTQFYLHAARFLLPLVVASGAAPGRHAARVRIRFQACREDLCLPPATLTLTAPARIVRR